MLYLFHRGYEKPTSQSGGAETEKSDKKEEEDRV